MKKYGGYVLVILITILPTINAQFESESEEDWLDPGDMLRYEGGRMRNIDEIESKPKVEKADNSRKSGFSSDAGLHAAGIEGQRDPKSDSREDLQAESRQTPTDTHQTRTDSQGPKTDTGDAHRKTVLTENHLVNSIYKESLEADRTSFTGTGLRTCSSSGKEGAFFRQFVTALLRKFPDDLDGTGVYQIIATLSESDFAALTTFSTTMEGLESAHDVLVRMIEDVRRTDRPQYTRLQKIERKLGFELGSLIQLAVILFLCTVSVILLFRLRLNLSFGRIVFRVFLLLFFVSIPWNWWYLYKMAVAKREVDMLKDVPEECRPNNPSAAKSIVAWLRSSFTFDRDECTKYHERMIVDPMWEVPPTQALAVTVTKFFLEPFKHIGTAFSDLIRGLLQDLPIQLWPIVLVLFSLFAFFFIILQSNYKIKVFWNAFGLEPQQQPQALPQPSSQSERQMIEELPRPQPHPPPSTVHYITGPEENLVGQAPIHGRPIYIVDRTISHTADPATHGNIGQTADPVNSRHIRQTDDTLDGSGVRAALSSYSAHTRPRDVQSVSLDARPGNVNGSESDEESLLPLSIPEQTPGGGTQTEGDRPLERVPQEVRPPHSGARSAHLGPESANQGAGSAHQGLQSASQEAVSAHQEPESANQGAGSAHQGPESANQGTGSAHQGPKSANQEAGSAHQGPQTANPGAGSAHQGPESANQGTGSAHQGPKSANQEAGSAHQGPQTANPGAGSAHQGPESVNQEAGSAHQGPESAIPGAESVHEAKKRVLMEGPAHHGAESTHTDIDNQAEAGSAHQEEESLHQHVDIAEAEAGSNHYTTYLQHTSVDSLNSRDSINREHGAGDAIQGAIDEAAVTVNANNVMSEQGETVSTQNDHMLMAGTEEITPST